MSDRFEIAGSAGGVIDKGIFDRKAEFQFQTSLIILTYI